MAETGTGRDAGTGNRVIRAHLIETKKKKAEGAKAFIIPDHTPGRFPDHIVPRPISRLFYRVVFPTDFPTRSQISSRPVNQMTPAYVSA